MLTTLYFDTPPVLTRAVYAAFAVMGGLDLDNPKTGYRDYTGFSLKTPRELSNEDVFTIANAIAELHSVDIERPVDIDDFRQLAMCVQNVAELIACEPLGTFSDTQDFDPQSTSNDDLVFGILHWCDDGNNLANAERSTLVR